MMTCCHGYNSEVSSFYMIDNVELETSLCVSGSGLSIVIAVNTFSPVHIKSHTHLQQWITVHTLSPTEHTHFLTVLFLYPLQGHAVM